MCIRDRHRSEAVTVAGAGAGTLAAQETTTFAGQVMLGAVTVSYTHLRAHETVLDLVCRLLLEKKKN